MRRNISLFFLINGLENRFSYVCNHFLTKVEAFHFLCNMHCVQCVYGVYMSQNSSCGDTTSSMSLNFIFKLCRITITITYEKEIMLTNGLNVK